MFPSARAGHRAPHSEGSSTQPGAFESFWMGGFEGADHVNGLGAALDMARANGHVDQIEADHARASALGIRTVRESIGWRLAEPSPGAFDLERVLRIAASARHHGVQVLWTFMHYGTPADVSLLDDAFCERFVRFAVTVARALDRGRVPGTRAPVYNLVNEIGFLCWAVSATNLMHPYRSDPCNAEPGVVSGHEVKCRLVRATLAATHAIRRIDPTARFLQVEPIVHVAAPRGRPDLAPLAAQVDGYQWQVWDMLAGHTDISLGGHAAALDLIGVNHYHAGQWEVSSGARLDWHERDPRRRPFASMLQQAWQRYARPLIVAETSHVGEGRAQWLHEIAAEVAAARASQVPVLGICLYPLVDRPDWSDPTHWHHSGLWDVDPADRQRDAAHGLRHEIGAPGIGTGSDPPHRRVLCADYAAALQRWQTVLPNPSQQERALMKCLIVFSHLRWSFVYQRPQHLMSRLSRHYRILFVEEPVHADGPARLDRISQGPNIEVLVPHTPIAAGGFHDDQLPLLEPLLSAFVQDRKIDETLVWFYTPMALPLLAVLKPLAVVYDCMDELSAFKNAPRQLRQRETALLKMADLVLTGGPALFEAKRGLHANAHCLPSSVDAAHYSPARLDAGSAHAAETRRLQDGIATPRLGYFGVIDERFDIALLQVLAQAHPEWQLVMVGPVVKIDPADLPRAPNIHWLGMQPYERLPYLMAGWDVCLMPFAMNESTRFISPTKTLEYMAGEKPIVSTPIGDVISLYGDTVRVVAAGPAFVTACEQALGESRAQRQQRIAQMLVTVQHSSWDRSAATVHGLIEDVLRNQHAAAIPAAFATPPEPAAPVTLVASTRSAAAG